MISNIKFQSKSSRIIRINIEKRKVCLSEKYAQALLTFSNNDPFTLIRMFLSAVLALTFLKAADKVSSAN